MKFKTVAEAFNYYRNHTVEQLEQRAAAIGNEIDTNADADIEALNIELRGIKEAKENIELRNDTRAAAGALSLVTGRDNTVKTFGADVYDTQEYRSAFFKSMLGQTLTQVEKAAFDTGMKLTEQRADAYVTSTDAAAIIPTTTLNEIVKKARKEGGLMSECRMFNMPTKIAVPVGTPASKADWHTEGAAVESEKHVPTTVVFDGYEIMKVFSISAKTRRMSIAAFESYLIDELTACVMDCIADALVSGTGIGQGTGLESGITWATTGDAINHIEKANGEDITYTDVVNTIALLKRGYCQGAKWAMNNATLYRHFYGMMDENHRPIFIADPKSESIGKILGFEVVIDDNIADHTAYLGNYAQYLGVNIPEGIAVEASTQSSFKKGLIDYRAMAIADCKPIVTEAFVKLSITPVTANTSTEG